ncbi:hypothetical protein A0H81_05779 [Grifola frondosa]|uniref:Uncharacterized protein n=1 Tax=Grifola frondosa TaxID=5627 RepID=A0A1C7MCP8_GRIFR|nr:hypothetical protein A0H81_05779 [Grifola frondosa]
MDASAYYPAHQAQHPYIQSLNHPPPIIHNRSVHHPPRRLLRHPPKLLQLPQRGPPAALCAALLAAARAKLVRHAVLSRELLQGLEGDRRVREDGSEDVSFPRKISVKRPPSARSTYSIERPAQRLMLNEAVLQEQLCGGRTADIIRSALRRTERWRTFSTATASRIL